MHDSDVCILQHTKNYKSIFFSERKKRQAEEDLGNDGNFSLLSQNSDFTSNKTQIQFNKNVLFFSVEVETEVPIVESELSETTETPNPEPEADLTETTTSKSEDEEGSAEPESKT